MPSNIKFVAWNSLATDFKKPGIPSSVYEKNCFGISCKQNGQLNTNTKGGFGFDSKWPHYITSRIKLEYNFNGKTMTITL